MTGLIWLLDVETTNYNWTDGISYCEALTTGGYEWRMPNFRELRSLVHYGQSIQNTWLINQGFLDVRAASYYCGTPCPWDTSRAIIMYMNNNPIWSFASKTDLTANVWPVAISSSSNIAQTGHEAVHTSGDDGTYQAGVAPPSTRFVNNGDGTVTDNMTGLMWVQNANAIGTVHTDFDSDGAVTWANALSFVSAFNDGTYDCDVTTTYSDWRLPTLNELETLVNYGQDETYTWLNDQGFSNVESHNYLSGTTRAFDTTYSWGININQSSSTLCLKSLEGYYVWPVRTPVE